MKDKQAVLSELIFRDIEPELPDVVPFAEVSQQPDIFIASLGFEQRAVAIAQQLAKKYKDCGKKSWGLIAEYGSNVEENEANRHLLIRDIGSFCERIEFVPGDRASDLGVALRVAIAGCQAAGAALHVMIDISAASGNLVLSLMHVLIDCAERRAIRLTVAYSEPQEYLPSEQDYASRGDELIESACAPGDTTSVHEFGVAEVETNEFYPGKSVENRAEFIIAIPAYRTERLSRCLQRLTDQPLADPDEFIYWIFGVPHDDALRFRLEMQKRVISRLLRDMSGHDMESAKTTTLNSNNSVEASTLDYRHILKAVMEKVDSEAGKNISLVHMGSKMQAIGVSLALAARSEVTVCYARPNRYNATLYSKGIGPAWGIEIADLNRLVQSIRLIGTLTFVTKIDALR